MDLIFPENQQSRASSWLTPHNADLLISFLFGIIVIIGFSLLLARIFVFVLGIVFCFLFLLFLALLLLVLLYDFLNLTLLSFFFLLRS